MSTREQPPAPSSGAGDLPPPPPPSAPGQFTAGAPIQGPPPNRKKPSKKLIIISSVALVVVLVAITAFFIVQNLLRGGSATPEEAGSKFVESINDKDVVSLFGMVSPREREAVMRLQKQAESTINDHGIAEAIKRTSPASAAASVEDAELSLDGVDIAISGATPTVTELSEDYALIRYTSGEITMTINPEQTKGLIRAGFESGGNMETVTQREFIADLGPQKSGVTLVASKADGRWYVSPMLSALDSISTWSSYGDGYGSDVGNVRGFLPESFQPGGDQPEDAAASGIRSMVDAVNQNDLQLLAPALAKDEAAALYLYSNLWYSSGASGSTNLLTLGDASFTSGAVSGNRAQAIAENVSIGVDDDHIVISDSCIADAQGEQLCLNGSSFFDVDGETASNAMSLASIDGKFALTTVKEDGKWKVSLLDSAADAASSWLKSLTPEQSLAFLGLDRAAEANGDIAVGTKVAVPLNSAGYAVQKFKVVEGQKVSLESEVSLNGDVFTPDGEGRMASDSHNCSIRGTTTGCELATGDYVLVLDASGSEQWAEGFKNEGNSFQMAPELTVARFVDPPRINGSTEATTVYMGEWNPSASISIPEKTGKKLVLEFAEGTTVPDKLELSVGENSTSLDGRTSKRLVIEPPQETGDFTIFFEGQGDPYDWYDVHASLYFADE